MYRFIVQDSETGTKIEECDSFREAQDIILAFERADTADGCYTSDFYEIYDRSSDKIVTDYDIEEC